MYCVPPNSILFGRNVLPNKMFFGRAVLSNSILFGGSVEKVLPNQIDQINSVDHI